jgi:hypothetical protein
MRLIDADKLHYHRVWIASIKKGEYNGMKSAVVVFADEIDKNKKAMVDAVPVVRCKDCKWYQLDPWGYKYQCEKIYDVADGDLDAFYFRPSPDHFCAYGERKEETGR